MTSSTKRFWLTIALIGVAVVWGSTFITVKDAVAQYPVYSFLAIRFLIASVFFIMLFPKAFKRFKPGTVKVGAFAGVILASAYIFQTVGLQTTTASKTAFITGMFVVLTPVLQALVLKRPPRIATVVGVGLAVCGLWLLSGGPEGGWNSGDTLVLACALGYSVHMIMIGGPGRNHDPIALTLVQLIVITLLCSVVALATETPTLPSGRDVFVALAITGVLASALAFWIQTTAQRFLSPTKTALILILEPVFGGLFGWLAGEALGVPGLIGSGLILAGMVVSELSGAGAAPEEHVVLETTMEGPAVPVIEEPLPEPAE